jgi:hypothetical protein
MATKEAKIRITATDKTKAAIKSAQNNLRSLQRIANSVAPAIAGIISVKIGGSILKLASDAQEAKSKFDAVFGSQADGIRAQIKSLSDVIPLATHEFEAMTAEIQDLLVPLGFASESASGLSVDITKLAADLASFNNLPIAEALERIRSGLVGQYEPLLKFGVALNANTVKAQAFAMGIGDGKRQLTASERAIVSYKMILDSTRAAQGDAAVTAGSLANQWKFAQANAKNLGVEVGEKLLPSFTSLLNNANSLKDGISGVGQAVVYLLKGFATLLNVGQSVFMMFSAGVIEAVALGRALYEIATTAIAPLVTGLEALGASAAAAFESLKNPFGDSAKFARESAAEYLKAFKDSITGMPAAMMETLSELDQQNAITWDSLVENLKANMIDLKSLWSDFSPENDEGFAQWAAAERDAAIASYDEAFQAIFAKWKEMNDKMKSTSETTGTMIDDVAKGITSMGNALENGLVNAAKNGKAAFGDMAQFILAEIQRILIRSLVLRPLFGFIGGMIGDNPVGNAFSNSFGGGKAGGGMVGAGRSYMVGERGPEMVTMGSNGYITPNDKLGGGPVFNVDMRGASVEAVARLEQFVGKLNGSIERRALAAVGDARSRQPAFLMR